MSVEARKDPAFIAKSVEFNTLSKAALDSLTDESVTAFLRDALITRYDKCPYIAIRDGSTQKLYLYKAANNPVVRGLNLEQFPHCRYC